MLIEFQPAVLKGVLKIILFNFMIRRQIDTPQVLQLYQHPGAQFLCGC